MNGGYVLNAIAQIFKTQVGIKEITNIMSRILVTGNPNYEGLCKGIYEAYNNNRVEFIGRHNGWDMNDAEKVANHAKDFDVFVNSLYGPDGQQNRILEEVYKKFEENLKFSNVKSDEITKLCGKINTIFNIKNLEDIG